MYVLVVRQADIISGGSLVGTPSGRKLSMRLPRRRSIVWISMALVILLALASAKPAMIAYHRYQLERCWKVMIGELESTHQDPISRIFINKTDISNSDYFDHHQAALVSLGELIKIEYTFRHIELATPEWKHLWRRIDDEKCPAYDQNGGASVSGRWSAAPEPVHLQIWCNPSHREEWLLFLKSVDVADYRDRYGGPASEICQVALSLPACDLIEINSDIVASFRR